MGQFDFLKDYCKVVYLERTKNISSTILRIQNKQIQRIGIIGTGRIAERFIPEAKLVSGISVEAVYNPHMESAIRYANRWGVDYYKNLEEFYHAVDSVYIASPHETHYQYIKTALEHGKHVLCEKPMVLKGEQARELFSLAKEKGLVLFEGIKTAYCPGFSKMMGMACSGLIGTVRNVEACFTKLENPKSRELTDLQYGGSFIELGSYVMLPIVKMFGYEPKQVRFDRIDGENGLDLFTKAYFQYPNGLGTATCGLGVKSEGQLIISGTKGYILAEAPWWKTAYFEIHHENPNDVEKFSERFLEDGLRYEISDFLSFINGNKKNGFKLTPEDSVVMAGVMEGFLRERKK